jgi:hypothetical protein
VQTTAEGRFDDALAYLKKRSALEDKPAAKALAGILDQPLIDSKKAGAGPAPATFETEFRERVQKLPYRWSFLPTRMERHSLLDSKLWVAE